MSVALAFVGNPDLVLLDEPTTGLDVDARRTLWDALRRQHERGATVVVTSHYLEEIEALAERVIVMGEGRVVADDSLSGVLERVGLRWVRLESTELAAVAALEGVVPAEDAGSERAADAAETSAGSSGTFLVRDSDAFVRALVLARIPFRNLSVRGATLEEAFLSLTAAPAEQDSKPRPIRIKESI